MSSEGRLREMVSIVAAARRYRDLMRRYMSEQAERIERGASLDDLVMNNWEHFGETVAAEEELFRLLDALDAHERGS